MHRRSNLLKTLSISFIFTMAATTIGCDRSTEDSELNSIHDGYSQFLITEAENDPSSVTFYSCAGKSLAGLDVQSDKCVIAFNKANGEPFTVSKQLLMSQKQAIQPHLAQPQASQVTRYNSVVDNSAYLEPVQNTTPQPVAQPQTAPTPQQNLVDNSGQLGPLTQLGQLQQGDIENMSIKEKLYGTKYYVGAIGTFVSGLGLAIGTKMRGKLITVPAFLITATASLALLSNSVMEYLRKKGYRQARVTGADFSGGSASLGVTGTTAYLPPKAPAIIAPKANAGSDVLTHTPSPNPPFTPGQATEQTEPTDDQVTAEDLDFKTLARDLNKTDSPEYKYFENVIDSLGSRKSEYQEEMWLDDTFYKTFAALLESIQLAKANEIVSFCNVKPERHCVQLNRSRAGMWGQGLF